MAKKYLNWTSNNKSFTTNSYSRTISTEEKEKLFNGNNIIFTIQYYRTAGGISGDVNITNVRLCNTSSNITLTEITGSTLSETIDSKNIITKSFSGTIGTILPTNNTFSFTITFLQSHTVMNCAMYQGHTIIQNNIQNSISDFASYMRQNPTDKKWEIRTDSNTYEKIGLEADITDEINSHNVNNNKHGVQNICGLSEIQTLTNKSLLNVNLNEAVTGTAIVKGGDANSTLDTKLYSAKKIEERVTAVSGGSVGGHNIPTPAMSGDGDVHGIDFGQGNIQSEKNTGTLENKIYKNAVFDGKLKLDGGFTVPFGSMGNLVGVNPGQTAWNFTKINQPIDSDSGTITTNSRVKSYVDGIEEGLETLINSKDRTGFASFNIIGRRSDLNNQAISLIYGSSITNNVTRTGINMTTEVVNNTKVLYRLNNNNEWVGSSGEDHNCLYLRDLKPDTKYSINISIYVNLDTGTGNNYFRNADWDLPKATVAVGYYDGVNEHYIPIGGIGDIDPGNPSPNAVRDSYPRAFSLMLAKRNTHTSTKDIILSGSLSCIIDTGSTVAGTKHLGKFSISSNEDNYQTPNTIYVNLHNGRTHATGYSVYIETYTIKGTVIEI